MIAVEHLTKRYGSAAAADDLTFTVQPGEVVGFVGANGAGKTTTITMLLGLTRPTSGSIHLMGTPLTLASAHRSHRQIGYAAGDMALFEQMTGRDYLAFVMRQYQGNHQARYDELVKRFEPQLDKKIRALSRGNKQKLALVAAFVASPKLVILDEPTSGLDPVMQEAFLELVQEERASGTTIFMSSHYLHEVVDACSRVLLMRRGVITHDLTPDELNQQGTKQVRLVTPHAPRVLPKAATDTDSQPVKAGIETTFTYSGDIAELVSWIARQPAVLDIEITAQGVEEAFLELYQDEEAA